MPYLLPPNKYLPLKLHSLIALHFIRKSASNLSYFTLPIDKH